MACLAVPVFADMRQKEAIVLLDQNKPDSLFRYRALNQEREFENIECQQVWLSQAIDLNDPYDSSFDILHQDFVLPEIAQQELRTQLSQIVGDKLSKSELAEFAKFQDLPKERFRSLFNNAFPNLPIEHADLLFDVCHKVSEKTRWDHVQQLNKLAKRNLSVCCFCEARDQNPMWAYYADQHRGCCLEFDVRREFIPNAIGYLLPVIYKDGLFDVTPYYSAAVAGEGHNWSGVLAACHKGKDWSHEREWRMVFPWQMPRGKNNHPIPIKSITAGLKTEGKVQKRLFEIAQKLSVPFYRIVESRPRGKLQFEPVTELL